MTKEGLNYIKDAFSQIIDDIAGNPDWHEAARAVASDLGTLERELEEKNSSIPSNINEAAKKYEKDLWLSGIHDKGYRPHEIVETFKAGAEWQKEHDHDFCLTCEKNRDVVFHKGMQYAIEQMKKDAIELPVKIDGGGYPYIQITGIEFFDYDEDKPTKKEGDVVRILILDEDD